MIYMTSDQHYGHENIIKLCNRPFRNLQEMDETLIENHNKIIKSNDVVYFLGDFSYKSDYKNYINKLNGNKYLIKGNHDNNISNYEEYFNNIYPYLELIYNDYTFILFHYPIHEWKGFFKNNTIHLHGHNHAGKQKYDIDPWFKNKKIYNVCVDLNDFKPISLDEIINKFNV